MSANMGNQGMGNIPSYDAYRKGFADGRRAAGMANTPGSERNHAGMQNAAPPSTFEQACRIVETSWRDAQVQSVAFNGASWVCSDRHGRFWRRDSLHDLLLAVIDP